MAISKMRKIGINLLAVILVFSLVWWQTPLYAAADQGDAETFATVNDLSGKGVQGDSNGKLTARVLLAPGVDDSGAITFDKYLFGADGEIGQFHFLLSACDAEGNVLEGDDAYSETALNGEFVDGVAKVSFRDWLSHANATGDYYYLVEESSDETNEIEVDPAIFMVHVKVTDGVAEEPEYNLIEDGELLGPSENAFYNNGSASALRFHSMTMAGYSGEGGRVSVYPEVQKYLNGSTSALVGGDFEFTLVGEGVERTQTNDITGNVAFYDKSDSEGLVFDKAGTYTYKINEVIPKTATDNGDGTFTDGDLTFDGATITMSVNVTESDGELSAEVVYTGMSQGSAPAFYNERKSEGISKDVGLTLTVSKFDALTHEYVSDATLIVIDKETGKTVEKWDTYDAAYTMLTTLTPGKTYILREIDAPDGYDKVGDTTFVVSADGMGVSLTSKDATTKLSGSAHIQLYDQPQPVEKEVVETKKRTRTRSASSTATTATTAPTGDGIPLLPIVIIVVVALASLAAMLLSRRKAGNSKDKQEKE